MKNLMYVQISLLLIVLNINNIFAKKDSINVGIVNGAYVTSDTLFKVENNDWLIYKFDVSPFKRDSIFQIGLNLNKGNSDTTILNIDSIIATGEKDTLLLENFDKYNVNKRLVNQNFFLLGLSPERLWESYFATNGTDHFDQIFISSVSDSDKHLRLNYSNHLNNPVYLIFYLNFINWDSLGSNYTTNYLDFTKYNVLQIKIRKENTSGIINQNDIIIKSKFDYFYDAKTNSIVLYQKAYFNIVKIELFDLYGKQVYNTEIISKKIKRVILPNLSSGVYLLTYTIDKDIKVGKLIVNK